MTDQKPPYFGSYSAPVKWEEDGPPEGVCSTCKEPITMANPRSWADDTMCSECYDAEYGECPEEDEEDA